MLPLIPVATSIATIFASLAIYIGNKHRIEKSKYFDKKGFVIDINFHINQNDNSNKQNVRSQETITADHQNEVRNTDSNINDMLMNKKDDLNYATTEESLTYAIMTKLDTIDKDINAIISEYPDSLFSRYENTSKPMSILFMHLICFILGVICTILYHRVVKIFQKYYQTYKMNVINGYETKAINLLESSCFDEASILLKNALSFISRFNGKNHVEYGAFTHLLAKCEISRGNIIVAESLLQNTLEIYDYHALQDAVTARVLEDLSELIYKNGKLENAYTLLQNALYCYELDIKNNLWIQYEKALKKSKTSNDRNVQIVLQECEKMYRHEIKESAKRKAKNAMKLKVGDQISKQTLREQSHNQNSESEPLEIVSLNKHMDAESSITNISVQKTKIAPSKPALISYQTSLDVARVNMAMGKILMQNHQYIDALDVFSSSYKIYENNDMLDCEQSKNLKETILLVTKQIEEKNNIVCPEVTQIMMKSSPRGILTDPTNLQNETPIMNNKSSPKYLSSSSSSPDTIMCNL